MRSRALLVAFLSIAFYDASIVTISVHELAGHGLVALLFGGSVDGFFISATGGVAYARLPDGSPTWQVIALLAAGVAVNLLTGAGSWLALRRCNAFAVRVFLLDLFSLNVVASILYVGIEPVINLATRLNTGDFSRIFTTLRVAPLLPALIASAAGTAVVVEGMRQGKALARTSLGREWGAFAAIWALFLPGCIILLAQLAITAPWANPLSVIALPIFMAVTLIFTGIAGAYIAWRGPVVGTNRPTSAPSNLAPWTGVLMALAILCLVAFGPAEGLGWGLLSR